MRIRNAEANDLPRLSALYAALDADAERFQPEHFSCGARRAELIERHLNDPDSAVFILESGEEALGLVHVQLQEPMDTGITRSQRFACVWDIVVREDYRGKGAGSVLLGAAKRWGRERGAQYMRLNVLAQNEAALRFYEKHGFSPTQLTLETRLS